jgi:hypothetical protein
MRDTIHYVLGDEFVMCIVSGTSFLSGGIYQWKCTKSRYPMHMYYTICSSHVGPQLMNMKFLEQILRGCIVAIDSAIHNTPEIMHSCDRKLDEVTY